MNWNGQRLISQRQLSTSQNVVMAEWDQVPAAPVSTLCRKYLEGSEGRIGQRYGSPLRTRAPALIKVLQCASQGCGRKTSNNRIKMKPRPFPPRLILFYINMVILIEQAELRDARGSSVPWRLGVPDSLVKSRTRKGFQTSWPFPFFICERTTWQLAINVKDLMSAGEA